METNNMSLPSRSYWEGFKARNAALWDKVKNNTFVNMFIPIRDIEDGNSIAAISGIIPGKQAVTTTTKTVVKPVAQMAEKEAKVLFDQLMEKQKDLMLKLGGFFGMHQVSAAERPAVVKELNELNKKLSEFYDVGFSFTKYKTPSNNYYVGPTQGVAKDKFAQTQADYFGDTGPFYERSGGKLNYLNYFN